MIWAFRQFEWRNLRAAQSAAHVPAAIMQLVDAKTSEDAQRAYWRIDNVVVVQGALYEAALPTTKCATIALAASGASGRTMLLELLVQLGSGVPDQTEIALGNHHIQSKCRLELCRAASLYFHYLQSGCAEDKMHCVDLLGLCALSDASLAGQVVWHLSEFLTHDISNNVRLLVENWIGDLRPNVTPRS